MFSGALHDIAVKIIDMGKDASAFFCLQLAFLHNVVKKAILKTSCRTVGWRQNWR